MACKRQVRRRIGGVKVHLFASDGMTTIDDPNQPSSPALHHHDQRQRYPIAFTNLYPGQYVVQWDTPAGYKRAVYLSGAAGATTDNDSDMQTTGGAAGKSARHHAALQLHRQQLGCGLCPVSRASADFVWRDNNGNGIQDARRTGYQRCDRASLSMRPMSTPGSDCDHHDRDGRRCGWQLLVHQPRP